ncbi:MAG: hypothetical protein ABII89_07705 [Candidatus Omnitrophota bacterium]
MKRTKIWGRIAAGLMIVGLAGCATAGLRQAMIPENAAQTDAVNVTMNVLLERGFVQQMSHLGGGAAVMAVLVGPFSNNKIVMFGEIREKGEGGKVLGNFSKGLEWGENEVSVSTPVNSEIKLSLRVGGTRSGTGDIGTVAVGDGPTQTIRIKLTDKGANIE